MVKRPELASGRNAYRNGEWAEAYDAFSRADAAVPIPATDLEAWANTAYLLGREHAYEGLLDRAHQRYLDRGDVVRGAYCAAWLGLSLAGMGLNAQASGWFSRARRLLGDVADQTVVHGYLRLADALAAAGSRSFDEAYSAAISAVEIGGRFNDRDLSALSLQAAGRALLVRERVEEGLALLDEAMVVVSSGELKPQVAGIIYCSVIDACRATYSLRRAHEWTTALTRWCEEQPLLVAFTGECRVARAEMLVLQGAWHDAVAEAERASQRPSRWSTTKITAAATYQRAEVFRLRGDFATADRAYRAAARAGGLTQPGLALLRLAEGRLDKAESGLNRALEETPEPLKRARLLPAKVELAFAAAGWPAAENQDGSRSAVVAPERLEEARSAADELAEIAAAFVTPALATMASFALGTVELAEGNVAAAVVKLRAAADGWRDLSAPYETARVSLYLGLCCRLLGDEEGAELEFASAGAGFERLGAAPDLARLASLRGNRQEPGGLTPRERQVLARLAAGETNRAIAAALEISERTVDRHVSNIFDKLGVASRTEAATHALRHGLI